MEDRFKPYQYGMSFDDYRAQVISNIEFFGEIYDFHKTCAKIEYYTEKVKEMWESRTKK